MTEPPRGPPKEIIFESQMNIFVLCQVFNPALFKKMENWKYPEGHKNYPKVNLVKLWYIQEIIVSYQKDTKKII